MMQECSDTYPFTFIVPTLITDESLVSTSVSEDDHPIYDAATTYAAGDKVIVTTGYHKIYQSLEADNLNKFPPNSPLSWVEVGPTNAWAMFDDSPDTRTVSPTTITFQVFGDRFNSISFLGLKATSVRIVAESVGAGGVYYDESFTLDDSGIVLNWYQYFFSPILRKTELSVTDIPPIGESTYTITIEPESTAELETFVIGVKEEFGRTQYGASAGIIDYSKKEADQFGNARLVRRKFSKRMEVKLWLDKAETDYFYRRLVDIRATPVLWIAAKEQYEALTIYGFYRDFNIDIAYPSVNFCSLQIEGLS